MSFAAHKGMNSRRFVIGLLVVGIDPSTLLWKHLKYEN